jgi:hypothetical protein
MFNVHKIDLYQAIHEATSNFSVKHRDSVSDSKPNKPSVDFLPSTAAYTIFDPDSPALCNSSRCCCLRALFPFLTTMFHISLYLLSRPATTALLSNPAVTYIFFEGEISCLTNWSLFVHEHLELVRLTPLFTTIGIGWGRGGTTYYDRQYPGFSFGPPLLAWPGGRLPTGGGLQDRFPIG